VINKVNAASVASLAYKPNQKTEKKESKVTSDYDSAFSVDLSSSAKVKKGEGLSTSEIESIKNQADLSSATLKDVVEKLILKQQDKNATFKLSQEVMGSTVAVPKTQAEAVAALAENGDWGVEAVSDRILSFAKSISNGDQSKIEMLREANDKGFASVQKTLGGKLPDISTKTYDAVMSKLDAWAAESETGAAESTESAAAEAAE
jgi:hypothetical protein